MLQSTDFVGLDFSLSLSYMRDLSFLRNFSPCFTGFCMANVDGWEAFSPKLPFTGNETGNQFVVHTLKVNRKKTLLSYKADKLSNRF